MQPTLQHAARRRAQCGLPGGSDEESRCFQLLGFDVLLDARRLTPHTSHLAPRTSHLTPHTSHLTPRTSPLTPHTSHLTPHTSPLTLRLPIPALANSVPTITDRRGLRLGAGPS